MGVVIVNRGVGRNNATIVVCSSSATGVPLFKILCRNSSSFFDPEVISQ